MPRAQVKVLITDDSYVIPASESGSTTVAGLVSSITDNLVKALGNTAERANGYMNINSSGEWTDRLTSTEPTGYAATATGETAGFPFYHFEDGQTASGYATGGNMFAGGNTYGRWPGGPTGHWQGDWWCVNNFLQYGGVCIVGTSSAKLQDKSIPLDVVFAGAATAGGGDDTSGTGINGHFANTAKITETVNVATNRQDCIAVIPNGGTASVGATPSRPSGSVASEYVIEVYGQKIHAGINQNGDVDAGSTLLSTHCAPDVAGCLARTDKVSDPWISPAGFRRGSILNIIRLEHAPTSIEQDRLFDGGVNPITTFPGEGFVLWGDKTTKDPSSTLSNINVSRLFIYLKKIIGAAARSKLFELNDSQTRTSFKNAVDPVLARIKNRKGVYDYKVVCDESNNTSSVVDANEFVADIFVKPAKGIRYIQLTFTNKNTADSLT